MILDEKLRKRWRGGDVYEEFGMILRVFYTSESGGGVWVWDRKLRKWWRVHQKLRKQWRGVDVIG